MNFYAFKYNFILTISLVGLISFYLFQKNILEYLSLQGQQFQVFLITKMIRFFVNDFLMIGVIFGVFKKLEFVKIAILVQLAGFLFLLLPYLVIKYHYPLYNGPLVSFLHRLVLNPLLLILLVPALFYHQKIETSQNGK